MCGIAGIINFNGKIIDPYILKSMTRVISHRGPDDEGHVLLRARGKGQGTVEFRNPDEVTGRDLSGCNIGLGFRRLSIIDLSLSAHQPMSNEDDSIWIVFNGEFYNFKDYTEKLKTKGHIFKSKSDTEVIIHLYEEYGIDATLERINGMFAFALFDSKKGCLFLARDRVGIKPLYYYKSENKLVFASEIKAILEVPEVHRSFDSSKLFELFQNRYINSPDTVFYGIKKIIPGTYWKINVNEAKVEETFYWSIFDSAKENSEPTIEDSRNGLIQSINYRLRSDVPLGVFLSGGLDSSTICGIIRKEFKRELQTFSIQFDSQSGVDESWASRQVAEFLGTEHYGIEFESNVFDVLPEIVWHCEEPIADPALLPTYYLSKFTREHVTVALSGEGSDETNYGYRGYELGKAGKLLLMAPEALRRKLLRPFSFLPRSKGLESLKQLIGHPISDNDNEHFIPERIFKSFLKSEVDQRIRGYWWKERFEAKSIFDVKPLIHFHTWMQDDLLLKVDKMSMAHSLEVRVPYLDHNVIETASNIDATRKISLNSTKCILRKIAEPYIPTEIIKRKQHGFLVPLTSIFQDDLFPKKHKKSYLREYLQPANEIIDVDKTIKTLAPNECLTWDASVRLWLLAMVGLCIDQFKLSVK